MAKAFLSIGTNIGERLVNLNNAVSGLAAAEQIEMVKVSSIYETDAVGFEDQAAFFNIVIEIETSFPRGSIRLLLKAGARIRKSPFVQMGTTINRY